MKMGFHPSWLCVSFARRLARITHPVVASLIPPLVAPYHRLLFREQHRTLTGRALRALIDRLSRARSWLEWHSVPPVEVEDMTDEESKQFSDAEEAEINWRMTRMGAILLPALYFGSYFVAGVAIGVWRAFG